VLRTLVWLHFYSHNDRLLDAYLIDYGSQQDGHNHTSVVLVGFHLHIIP